MMGKSENKHLVRDEVIERWESDHIAYGVAFESNSHVHTRVSWRIMDVIIVAYVCLGYVRLQQGNEEGG